MARQCVTTQAQCNGRGGIFLGILALVRLVNLDLCVNKFIRPDIKRRGTHIDLAAGHYCLSGGRRAAGLAVLSSLGAHWPLVSGSLWASLWADAMTVHMFDSWDASIILKMIVILKKKSYTPVSQCENRA